MADRMRQLAVALAITQVADVIGNAVVPQARIEAHLDHLRVPAGVRRLLPVIKLASSAGLLAGLKAPRLGAVTASAMVAYYSAAATFHVDAGDKPVLAAPAAALGAGAALVWLGGGPREVRASD